MQKIEYSIPNEAPTFPEFIRRSIQSFERRHGVPLTIHAMSGRWYDKDGKYLFAEYSTHKSAYCQQNRYRCFRNNRACLMDCAESVEQECLKQGRPFLHNCWKGIRELIIPFFWNDSLELIFYVGAFQGMRPEEKTFVDEWEKLPPFPLEKSEEFMLDCQLLALAFCARLLKENQEESSIRSRKESIREYIFLHGCGNIRLSALAAFLGVSNSRASHLCITLFGQPFQTLVRYVRMQKAEFLLKETDDPLKMVASKTGFSNVYYFSRMFRRFFSETPAKFRIQHRLRENGLPTGRPTKP